MAALRRRKKAFGLALAAFAAAVVVAAVAGGVARHSRSHAAQDPGLSVLLISIDTLRADALGAYGSRTAETPWIDRLAGAGARFEVAHAHNVVTLPSHANLLSGQYPLTHGVRDNSGFRFPAGTPTLATILKQRGYRTGAFVSAFTGRKDATRRRARSSPASSPPSRIRPRTTTGRSCGRPR